MGVNRDCRLLFSAHRVRIVLFDLRVCDQHRSSRYDLPKAAADRVGGCVEVRFALLGPARGAAADQRTAIRLSIARQHPDVEQAIPTLRTVNIAGLGRIFISPIRRSPLQPGGRSFCRWKSIGGHSSFAFASFVGRGLRIFGSAMEVQRRDRIWARFSSEVHPGHPRIQIHRSYPR